MQFNTITASLFDDHSNTTRNIGIIAGPPHQQNLRLVPDGTRVAYHQFGYLHLEFEALFFNVVCGGTREC